MLRKKIKNSILIFFLSFVFCFSSCLSIPENLPPEIPICLNKSKDHQHQIVIHENYVLSYVEKFEQAEWVAYELTKDELEKNAKRSKKFYEDPFVETGSASPEDYKYSGYDRGHIAPAGDMTFSKNAMKESFYMSNMCPQVPELNRGLWKSLEEYGRELAENYESVLIVSGPILNKDEYPVIGENEVAVPEFFYKIFVYKINPTDDFIYEAWIVPNSETSKNPDDYKATINQIEKITKIDFFPKLKMNED